MDFETRMLEREQVGEKKGRIEGEKKGQHKAWGHGVVTKVNGTGEDMELDICLSACLISRLRINVSWCSILDYWYIVLLFIVCLG